MSIRSVAVSDSRNRAFGTYWTADSWRGRAPAERPGSPRWCSCCSLSRVAWPSSRLGRGGRGQGSDRSLPDAHERRTRPVHHARRRRGDDVVDVGSGPYGGTGSDLVCDRELLIRSLRARPDRLREWARVLDVRPTAAAVSRYIRRLRPVTLTRDTRVTNHSFVDGRAIAFQAILQAGTAVPSTRTAYRWPGAGAATRCSSRSSSRPPSASDARPTTGRRRPAVPRLRRQ